MKYRALDQNGDYIFGRGAAQFLVNTPETVAQAVKTRLLLIQGEWFLDLVDGTPYGTKILGEGTMPFYDAAIQRRILDTQGVTEITAYSSHRDPDTRHLTVQCTISTIYGQASFTQEL